MSHYKALVHVKKCRAAAAELLLPFLPPLLLLLLLFQVFNYHTSGRNGFTLFEEGRIAQLVAGAGFQRFSSSSGGMYVMFTAVKPPSDDTAAKTG
jgi:hypothetical protein